MTLKVMDDPDLLDWLQRRFQLRNKLAGGDQLFGPFSIRKRPHPLHVGYDAATDEWKVFEYIDDYVVAYPQRRGEVIRLADEHRGRMGRDEFVRFLIQAAIETGINRRAGIIETVEMAANREAVQQSIDTCVDYTSIPTEFGEDVIKALFDAGRGTRRGRGFWWVDENKTYHLY